MRHIPRQSQCTIAESLRVDSWSLKRYCKSDEVEEGADTNEKYGFKEAWTSTDFTVAVLWQ